LRILGLNWKIILKEDIQGIEPAYVWLRVETVAAPSYIRYGTAKEIFTEEILTA
jgi:hypothetical protein